MRAHTGAPWESTTLIVSSAAASCAATKAKAAASEAKKQAKELLHELEQAREMANALSALTSQPLPPIQRLEFGSGLREATAVALASDWHVEEMVKPGDTPNDNAYNLAIADLRIKRFFAAMFIGRIYC